MQEASLSSLARVDSHRPTKVVQVTSCIVDDAQSFNCSEFKEIPDIDVGIL